MAKEVTPQQIEAIKASAKSAMEMHFANLILDNAFAKALINPEVEIKLAAEDCSAAKRLVDILANINGSLLCLNMLVLCNFRAQTPIEKRFILRRLVVICHELYKYLYGFTKAQTDWETISPVMEKKYPSDCAEIKKQGEKYLKQYAQSEDRILRNVSNHYSDNPFEFFNYIAKINEKGQIDRALQMLRIIQPLCVLLQKELCSILKPCEGGVPLGSASIGECRFKDMFNDKNMEIARHQLDHRKEMARSQVQSVKHAEKFAAQYGYDITKDKRWNLLKDDNLVLHIAYLQMDTMVLSMAMNKAENELEEKLIIAYMVASMHEGFKKIYGFPRGRKDKTLWQRYAVNRQDGIKDKDLLSEIKLDSTILEAFSKQEYLNNPVVSLFLSHVGYVKDLNGDASQAMVDYLIKDDLRMELAGVIKVLFFMNELVDISGKLLNYENDVMGEEKKRDMEEQIAKIDELEKNAMLRVHNPKAKLDLRESFNQMRKTIRRLYSID